MATGMTVAFTTCKTMTSKNKEYRYYVSGNAPASYPTELWHGALYFMPQEALAIPKCYPYRGEWGDILSTQILTREDYPLPIKIDMTWLSIVEQRFYHLEADIPVERLQAVWDQAEPETFSHIVVGMAPFGGLALWSVGEDKSILIKWIHAKPQNVHFKDFKSGDQYTTLQDYCARYLDANPLAKENIEKNGLPRPDLYDDYMKQFTYRYLIELGQWSDNKKEWDKSCENKEEIEEFDSIEEMLFDGTHDKLHDDGLMNYHQAGKPKKLAVKWHIKKSEYMAYFWFEDEEICTVFDRFYGAHPETKTDFMIRIDSEKNKYELALYRYGLKEPQVISESAYQLLVFKNKFEYFRSENYNQPKGAWIW